MRHFYLQAKGNNLLNIVFGNFINKNSTISMKFQKLFFKGNYLKKLFIGQIAQIFKDPKNILCFFINV